MKSEVIIFLVFQIKFLQLFALIDNINYSILQDSIEQQPCIALPEYQSKVYNFQKIFPNISEINKLVLSGWFNFKGYPVENYSIFSLQITSELRISIQYNLQSHQIIQTVISSPISNNNIKINSGSWLQIVTTLEIDNINKIILAKTQIYDISFIFDLQSQPQSFNIALDLEQVKFYIGNPPDSLLENPACSFSKQVIIYVNCGINGVDYYADTYLYAKRTYLISHYDFFYSDSNKGKLLSDLGTNFNQIKLPHNRNDQQQTKDKELFKTEFLNQSEGKGLVLQFFMVVERMINPICKIAYVFSKLKPYYIEGQDSNIFRLTGQSDIDIGSNGIYKWNKITLIVRYGHSLANSYLFVNNNQGNFSSLDFPVAFSIMKIYFGDDTEYSCARRYAHIRIFSGSFLSESTRNNCQLQIEDSLKSCLFCKANYILNPENNMQCIEKNQMNTDNQIPGVKDNSISRQLCPSDMITDYSQAGYPCKCPKGKYRSGDECFQCPSYCSECSSLSECKKDPNRDDYGNCKEERFDDGFSCIYPYFKFSESKTKIFYLHSSYNQVGSYCTPPSLYDASQYLFDQNKLEFDIDSKYFYSFGFKIVNPPSGFSSQTISYIKENGIVYLNIKLIKKQFNLFSIQFDLNTQQKEFIFDQFQQVRIGYYTSNMDHILIVQVNGQILFDIIYSIPHPSIVNREFCIGNCDSTATVCLDFSDEISFIKDIPFPAIDGIPEMLELMRYQNTQYGSYKFDPSYPLYLTQAENKLSSDPNTFIQFQFSLAFFNLYQGFGFNNDLNYGKISSVFSNGAFFFSCSIEIIEINDQTSIIQFSTAYTYFVYIIPIKSEKSASIRLCKDGTCFDTTYAKLTIGEPNHLLIYQNFLKKEGQVGNINTETIIVCNYKREKFYYNQGFIGESITNLKIGASQSNLERNDYLIYMNNINTFLGNSFVYYDYWINNPCFIYTKKDQQQCILLKKGFLRYKNQFIKEEECQQFAIKEQKLLLIDYYSQTCLHDHQEQYGYCLLGKIVLGEFQCQVCQDINANGNKCKSCKSGYFLDLSLNICLQCSSKCSDCIEQSDNCTSCKYLNQLPPTCQCIDQKQYLDSSFQCQNCNYKCNSCVDDILCTSCSGQNRILPYCECNNNYEEIDFKCVKKIKCSSNCQECDIESSNCILCAKNRINPPTCDCGYGFESQSDGSCHACQQLAYYDELSKKCVPCSIGCKKCSIGLCQLCEDIGLYPEGENCKCQNTQYSLGIIDGSLKCINKMNISVEFKLINNIYILFFTFDLELQQIDFNKHNLNDMISLYIQEVSINYYQLKDPVIVKNQLQIKLSVKNNIKATTLQVSVQDNQQFVNIQQTHILDDKYINVPFIFEIGPYLYKDNQVNTSSQDKLNEQLEELKSNNIVNLIIQFQFVFYILNTLQPSILFFLLNARLPPNLYKFYQLISQLCFPEVSDYMSNAFKTQFNILGIEIEQYDISYPSISKYKQLGLCSSIIVNNCITFYFAHLLIHQYLKDEKLTYDRKNKNICSLKVEF